MVSSFKAKQKELTERIGRVPPRSGPRRRLERMLRSLVADELERETTHARLRKTHPVKDFTDDEGQPLSWHQR